MQGPLQWAGSHVGLRAGRGRTVGWPRRRPSSDVVWGEGCPCPFYLRWTNDWSEGLKRRVASLPSPQQTWKRWVSFSCKCKLNFSHCHFNFVVILKGLFPCTNSEIDSQNCISGCERDQIRREGKDGGPNFLCWFRDYVDKMTIYIRTFDNYP
jgi:hypothetical protein